MRIWKIEWLNMTNRSEKRIESDNNDHGDIGFTLRQTARGNEDEVPGNDALHIGIWREIYIGILGGA